MARCGPHGEGASTASPRGVTHGGCPEGWGPQEQGAGDKPQGWREKLQVITQQRDASAQAFRKAPPGEEPASPPPLPHSCESCQLSSTPPSTLASTVGAEGAAGVGCRGPAGKPPFPRRLPALWKGRGGWSREKDEMSKFTVLTNILAWTFKFQMEAVFHFKRP